ncbi:uncharacterized protein LOC135685515 isoform X2 [Rhopilema esculentum]|eukprot:gene17731-9398_t
MSVHIPISDASLEDMCAISLEHKDDFCVSPPFGFLTAEHTGKMTCQDSSVIVLVRDSKFEGRDVIIEVNDCTEVQTIRKLISKKPILTTAHCHQTISRVNGKADSEPSVSLKTVDYVVLINTSHPLVKEQFEQAFQKAEDFLKERKNFRITIAISDSIRNYVDTMLTMEGLQIMGETNVWNCDIIIAHGLVKPRCADHFFACKNKCQTALWCLCFPFCMVTGLPYLLYKKFFMGCKDETIKQTVPVTYHDGPFLFGFDILSLLYPPKHALSATSQYTSAISNMRGKVRLPSLPGPSDDPMYSGSQKSSNARSKR